MMHVIQNGRICYRRWCVPEPKCVLLLVHGLGAHGGRWEAFADFFVKRGISSYAIELGAPGPAATDTTGEGRESFRLYRNRILRLFDIAAQENPSKKLFLIGESMGALISFLLCAEQPGLASGLICISPAFAPGRSLTVPDYLRMFTPLLYHPEKKCALPFDSSMCTRDIDCRTRLDRDPCEYRSVPSRLLLEIAFAQVRAGASKKKMLTPTLFLIAGEDRIVDTDAARAVFRALAVNDKTLTEFPGMYHSLSIELGKEAVFEEILEWAERRISR